MSNNIIQDAANKVRNTGMVVPVTLVFVLMFIVSCALMYEDYSTSRLGYEMLPTHKANTWVIPLVALVPQLGQIGFAYVFMTDTRKQWAAMVAASLWAVDALTDIYYKAYGLNMLGYGIASVETVTIYTIGSEIMLTTSVAMLLTLGQPFFRRLGMWFGLTESRQRQPVQQKSQTIRGGA